MLGKGHRGPHQNVHVQGNVPVWILWIDKPEFHGVRIDVEALDGD